MAVGTQSGNSDPNVDIFRVNQRGNIFPKTKAMTMWLEMKKAVSTLLDLRLLEGCGGKVELARDGSVNDGGGSWAR